MTGGPEHGGPVDGALNLKQVAARLGVHYMTAYRYVRQGQLPAERVGNHWEVREDAVRSFRAEPEAASGPGADWVGRLEGCLLAGDEPAAWRVLAGALAAGHDPVTCYVDILSAALDRIGHRFAAGGLAASEQHVSTTLAIRLVARLGARFRRPGRRRGAVILGSPAGELHSLPVAIVADVVRLAGFEVVELGGDVPAHAFAEAAARTGRLVAVGVGVTAESGLDAVPPILEALRRCDPTPPVLVGGLAVASPRAAGLAGVEVVVGDARAAVEALERLAAPRRRPSGDGAPRR